MTMLTVRRTGGRWLGVLAASCVLPAGTIAAAAMSEVWLAESEIEHVLKGHMLEGVYATGRRFTEHYLEGGALEYAESGVTIHGHWSVTAGTLCTIYDMDPTGGCFRVSKSGQNCLEFYFVARSEEAAPGPPGVTPDWTARGTVDGAIEACKDGENV
ncbi:MAG: hypothetical protein ABL907_11815 [Hyphomicrobium sp.]